MQTFVDYAFVGKTQYGHRIGIVMPKLSDYLKTADAAEHLGVSQNTLRKWAEHGKIAVHRNPANGYRLFLRKDLDSFLSGVAKSAKPTKRKPK